MAAGETDEPLASLLSPISAFITKATTVNLCILINKGDGMKRWNGAIVHL